MAMNFEMTPDEIILVEQAENDAFGTVNGGPQRAKIDALVEANTVIEANLQALYGVLVDTPTPVIKDNMPLHRALMLLTNTLQHQQTLINALVEECIR
jgi:hypothetical protein